MDLLGLVGAPAPSPPELLPELPKPQFPFGTLPKPSHAPDPGVGGLAWPAATDADPENIINKIGYRLSRTSFFNAILRTPVVRTQCRTYTRHVF